MRGEVRRTLSGLLLAACVGGCATTPPPPPAPEPSPTSSLTDVAGVEVAIWIVNDALPPTPPPTPTKSNPRPKGPQPTVTLSQALAPFAECPSPLAEPARSIWIRSGMRIMALPAFQVAEFEQSLRVAGPVQRQFFAQTPKWSQAFRGPQAEGLHAIALDSGPVDISSGAFRLLMRCYMTPSRADAATPSLQIDMVPQFVDPRRGASLDDRAMLDDPFRPKPEPGSAVPRQGVVLDHMLLELVLGRDEVLVLVPEPDPPSPDATQGPSARETPFGPALPSVPTFAEALLSDALVGGDGRVKAVLMFRPILPERFMLAP
ncbi:MAG: hypothetical protein WCK33_07245 [Phycisphaerae bacterium]|jgi:hypothetical protein